LKIGFLAELNLLPTETGAKPKISMNFNHTKNIGFSKKCSDHYYNYPDKYCDLKIRFFKKSDFFAG